MRMRMRMQKWKWKQLEQCCNGAKEEPEVEPSTDTWHAFLSALSVYASNCAAAVPILISTHTYIYIYILYAVSIYLYAGTTHIRGSEGGQQKENVLSNMS